MKQKHLESCLSALPNKIFREPKCELEQYPTSVNLTASIILTAISKGDAGPGTSILDLGCGTGMLGLGFALVQSDMVRSNIVVVTYYILYLILYTSYVI